MAVNRTGARSPIHVHVDKSTPVHVHLKEKIAKASSSLSKDVASKQKRNNLKKSPKTNKRPFIPPPGKTSPGRPLAWESKSHRLEISQPAEKSGPLHYDDLSTSEDEVDRETSKMYESKVTSLLNEMSVNETQRIKEKAKEQLEASRRLLEDQEFEIKNYRTELDCTIQNYEKLRKSMEVVNKEVEIQRNETQILAGEKESLMQKLMDVELDGRKASAEIGNLRSTCAKLKLDKKVTKANLAAVTSQQDILLNKLEEFEDSNKVLRKMLKQAQKREKMEEQIASERDMLLEKLTRAEAKLQEKSAKLIDQDHQIDTLIAQIEASKDQASAFNDLQKTMETTRAHLQNQLRQKEGDNDRLAVKLKNLEQEVNVTKLEIEHLQGLLVATRDKAGRDKDALKKATRIQRERANRQEESSTLLQQQLTDQAAELDQLRVSLDDITINCKNIMQERDEIRDEESRLKRLLVEVAGILEISTKLMKKDFSHFAEKLNARARILKNTEVDNADLKEEVQKVSQKAYAADASATLKLNSVETEVTQLRSAVSQYESLTSEYKSQLEKYRKENDDLQNEMRVREKDTHKKLKQSVTEVEEVRASLQSKILDLQPYPELLKASEVRLKDAQERASAYEMKANENSKLVSELTYKIELQSEQMEGLRDKYKSRSDDNKILDAKLIDLEKKLNENDSTHRDLILSLSRKDDALHALQERNDFQQMENDRLVQQLEVALSDARKQTDHQKEKALAKERSAQARIMDLEAQLSRSTQTTQQLKRGREEAERKFNSRLQDMRDRLEQANSTTRSMQNYVHFLKTTYASVFTEDIDEGDSFTAQMHY